MAFYPQYTIITDVLQELFRLPICLQGFLCHGTSTGNVEEVGQVGGVVLMAPHGSLLVLEIACQPNVGITQNFRRWGLQFIMSFSGLFREPCASSVLEGTVQKEFFISIDSAPPGFSKNRSPLVCILFLSLFCLISAALLSFPTLRHTYSTVLTVLSGSNVQTPQTLHFRLFFLAFALTFWFFAAGDWVHRVRLLLPMTFGCVVVTLLMDLFFIQLSRIGGPSPFSLTGDIITGYAVLLALGGIIFRTVELPAGVEVHTKLRKRSSELVILAACILGAAALVAGLFYLVPRQIEALRNVALLGGLGPGLFLFSPVFMWLVYLASVFRRRVPGNVMEKPSVAFLVAALNESLHIAECIRSLDVAAARYKGTCRLYLVDNGSTDGTADIARRELASCRALSGEVLHCSIPGKARALNFGLQYTREEILVRVDADTVVEETLLQKLVPYFSDPAVGGVGGLPLPKDTSYLLAKMRSIEVYYNIAFQRVGQTAIEAVNVIPGIMSAYRRELLVELGGFVEGINGEDTDMTVRVGRLGYRILIDPSIHVYSEVPRTFRHLREQRLRWSRSFFHVFARNASAIRMRQGARGLWSLPMGFVAVFRRSIVVPTLLYAGLVALIDPSALFLRQGAAIGAVIVGPSLFMTTGVLLINRRLDLLPYTPIYLIFRLLRTYIALEAFFTLQLKGTTIHSKKKSPEADKSIQLTT